jgi:KipI family sensor histidine kinase inhibitor
VDGPRLLPLGDTGLVAEFGGDTISDEANSAVRALLQVLQEERPAGMLEAVPTYRSLLIVYDPLVTTAATLGRAIEDAASRADPGRLPPGRLFEIPVAYGGTYGPDLPEVASETGLTDSDIIGMHTGREYRVYMLGFTPGFPYMGALDPKLRVSRLASPRLRVPGRSVAIAGEQTGVYPIESPGGWRLIGRTPLRIYDPARPEPFLMDVGDRARFIPISLEEYERRAPAEEEPHPSSAPLRPALVVEKGGLFTTVQDLGRMGYRRFGLPQSGAMDPLSLTLANLLLGNAPGAAALEFASPGPRLVAARHTAVAVCGAEQTPTLNGRPIPMWTAVTLREGDILAFGIPRAGQWTYLALAGGIDVPLILGSRSTYSRARLGGYGGRRLEAGDRLASPRPDPQTLLRLPEFGRPPMGRGCTVGVVRGPQDSYFAEDALRTLFAAEWHVTLDLDRLGYRLQGPPLVHREREELLSDGLLPGAIQVPSGGQPIVIMPDGPTTGGYPKIGAVLRADLRKLAQSRPSETVRFQEVSWERAHLSAREEAASVASLRFERVA